MNGELPRRVALRTAAALAGATALASCGIVGPPQIRTPYRFGLHVEQNDVVNKLRHAEISADRKADVLLYFAKIGEEVPDVLEYLVGEGYDLAVCLEFWEGHDRADPHFSLASIVRGDHDSELRRWLSRLARLPAPVRLRPLHEFNGDWYPWGIFAPSNVADHFIPAWRHVAGIARRICGDRVLLQLCYSRTDPVASAGWTATGAARLFPGRDVVDELAVNGYNRPRYHASLSFSSIFEPYYRRLRTLHPTLPLWIGETACTERFHDKASWIAEMFTAVHTSLPVACLTWFHESREIPGEPLRDWAFTTSAAAEKAFQKGVRQTGL
ncbi:glycoside hydrolase family 26 protein [Streptomyces sp. NPDC056707]|uniref:glycoside hydrolase family 26 protein n=1 Tax=Streptomyces sp. NPDC056707 TaxID=3345919 RepID=UPI0036CE43EC